MLSTHLIIATSGTAKDVVPWAAIVAAAVALLKLAWDSAQAKRDRRADIYSEAFKAAVAWSEMWFRVRRRPADGSGDQALVERFHELQEQITYYESWTAAHSEWMGHAYCSFVAGIKAAAQEPLQRAWIDPPCPPSQQLGRAPFDLRQLKKKFSDSVRDSLRAVPDTAAIRRRYPQKTGL